MVPCHQTIEDAIDLAIQWNVRRNHSTRRAVCGNDWRVRQIFRRPTSNFGMVVRTIDLPAGQPSNAAPDENIRRKMFLLANSGNS